jgi:hypothetical protein
MSPTRVLAQQRRQEAMKLRAGGATYATIATKLGVTEMAAWKMIQKGMDILNSRMIVDGERLRRETLTNLEGLLQVYLPKALQGDNKAAHICLRALGDRARLYSLIRSAYDQPQPPKMTEEELRWEGYRLGLCPKPDSLPAPSSNGVHTTSGPTIHGGRF